MSTFKNRKKSITLKQKKIMELSFKENLIIGIISVAIGLFLTLGIMGLSYKYGIHKQKVNIENRK